MKVKLTYSLVCQFSTTVAQNNCLPLFCINEYMSMNVFSLVHLVGKGRLLESFLKMGSKDVTLY